MACSLVSRGQSSHLDQKKSFTLMTDEEFLLDCLKYCNIHLTKDLKNIKTIGKAWQQKINNLS